MKVLTIGDKEFNMCSGYEDFTFSQFIELNKVLKSNYKHNKRTAYLIASISDNSEELKRLLLNELSTNDFKTLVNEFLWLNEPITELKAKNGDLEIEGIKYRVIQNYNNLPLADMVNIETMLESFDGLDEFEIALGVFLRPLDENDSPKKFSKETFDVIVKNLKDKVMLRDVYEHLSFFLSGEIESTTKSSKGFSIRQK